jgi:hypothetical protein
VQTADRIALADGWWDMAEREKSLLRKSQLLAHSKILYESALPDATALVRAKIDKRLAEFVRSAGPGAALDLLALIDPKQDAVSGEFKSDRLVLTIPSAGNSPRIQIPYAPPPEYDLSFVAERKEGTNSLNIGLVFGAAQCMLIIDGTEAGDTSGLEMIDGKNFAVNETTSKGRLLPVDKPKSVVCAIRKDGVTVTVDGKKAVTWKGEAKRLSVFSSWQVPNKDILFLGSSGVRFQISRMILTPISGQGKRLR